MSGAQFSPGLGDPLGPEHREERGGTQIMQSAHRETLILKIDPTGIDAVTGLTCTAATTQFQTTLRSSQRLGGTWILREIIAETGGSAASNMTGIVNISSPMFEGRTEFITSTTHTTYTDKLHSNMGHLMVPFQSETGGNKSVTRESFDASSVVMDLAHPKVGWVEILIDKVGSNDPDTLYNADLYLTFEWMRIH